MPAAARQDADFSRKVLRELYSYPRKRRAVAWLLWLFLGWAGAHRFYLNREFTGLAMLFTGGGVLLWWGVDAFLVDRMVLGYNNDQALRKVEGRPPRELDAMPPLDDVVLDRTPEWVERWRSRGVVRRGLRLAGDVLVLLVAASALGGLIGEAEGALEAGVAVLLLVALTAMGSGPDWIDDIPGVRGLPRWSHQLRLFYRYNPPGFFLLLEVVPEIVVPAILPGRSVALGSFVAGWVGEVFLTFFFVYAFATPVGAVLTRHLLIERTHTVPRLLCGLTAVMLFLGWLG